MSCQRLFTVLSGCLIHSLLSVCPFPEERIPPYFSILWLMWPAGKKRRFSVLFIDWEAQYQCTIEHVQKMREMYRDVTDTFYWVALPLTTVNGVSQFQPEWICWEPGVKWVRLPPDDAITDISYFPFYR